MKNALTVLKAHRDLSLLATVVVFLVAMVRTVILADMTPISINSPLYVVKVAFPTRYGASFSATGGA